MGTSTKFIIKTNQASIDKFNKSLDAMVKKTKDADKADKTRDGLIKSIKTRIDQLSASYGKLKGSVMGALSPLSKLTMVLGGFGLAGIFGTAFHLNFELMNLRANLQRISDTSGDTTKAFQMQVEVWRYSKQSLAQVAAAMTALGDAGLQVGPAMEELAIFTTNLSQATGISADKLAGLTGELHAYWGVSVKGAAEVAAAAVNTQKVFGTTSSEIELMLGVIKNAQNKLGVFFKDGETGAKALAKGISMASGVLKKFGVNAQVATEFIDRLLDPDKFSETATLVRMLGISFEDQMKMMEGAAGKEMFFDKLMKNLPVLSQKIQSIQNPLARWTYAKNLGLPPEIAAKIAKASAGQIGTIIQQYKDQMAKDKLAQEKQKKAQAAAERYQDQLLLFKLKVLQPLMQFTMHMFGVLMSKLSGPLGGRLKSVFEKVAHFLTQILEPAVDVLAGILSGDSAAFNKGMSKFADGVLAAVTTAGKLLMDFVEKNSGKIWNIISKIISTGFSIGFRMFMAAPWWLKFVGVIKLMTMLKGPVGMIQGLVSGLKGGPVAEFVKGIATAAKSTKLYNVAQQGIGKVSTSLTNLMRGAKAYNVARAAAVEQGFSGSALKGVMKFAGPEVGAGSKILAGGMRGLSAVGNIAAKAAIPLMAIVGGFTALSKAGETFGQKQTSLTSTQKAAAFSAGALTLGLAPLIDSLLGTTVVTKTVAEAFVWLRKNAAMVLGPLNEIFKIFDAFSDKPIPEGVSDRYEEINNKIMLGQKLTEKEQKEYDALGKTIGDTYMDLRDGIYNYFDAESAMGIELANMKEKGYNAETKAIIDKTKKIKELNKRELDALKTKMIETGRLTQKELERYKTLQKAEELSPIARMMRKISLAWFNMTFTIRNNIEDLQIDIEQGFNKINQMIANNSILWAIFGEGDAEAYKKGALAAQLESTKKRKEALDVLQGVERQYLGGVQKGGVQGLKDVATVAAKVYNVKGMSEWANTVYEHMEAQKDLMIEEQSNKLEDLLKSQEKATSQLGGIGSDTRAMKDVVAKPAAPSRADLIGAMIGTYGMTSWTFHI